jgi:hypothetical protein
MDEVINYFKSECNDYNKFNEHIDFLKKNNSLKKVSEK